MKLEPFVAAALLILGALFVLFTPGLTPPISAQGAVVQGPFVESPVAGYSLDVDLRELPDFASASGSGPVRPWRRPRPVASRLPATPQSDPARQTTVPKTAMPAPLKNFAGLDFANNGDGWPPDTNGDVGPAHYIQTVNTSLGIFDKNGTLLVAKTLNAFWSISTTTTPCKGYNQGDPVVLYDAVVDRWLIMDMAWKPTQIDSGPYYECLAISKTGNPVSGGWWLYPLRMDDNNHPWLNDYAKIGVWADGYYVSANMFDLFGGGFGSTFEGVRVWALDRTSMLTGTMKAPVRFDLPCTVTSCPTSLLPANLRGAPPPVGTPDFFASIDDPSTNVLHLWKFHTDWATPASSTLTAIADLAVAPFTTATNLAIPQPGTAQSLDNLGDRLMMQLQYRNLNGTQSLWANHTVVSNGVAGIRWYEVRDPNGTPYLNQQGTFQPDANYRWMASLAVDNQGSMALGYSVSASSMYPSIAYVGRLAGDSPGTLGQGETTLVTGTGAQQTYNRWGDYTAMTVDPTDDCTFWYTNEYYQATGIDWQTRIGSFKFPGCVPPPQPVTIQERDPAVQYDGWAGVTDTKASFGAFRESHTQNDTATFTFTGTGVTWVFAKGPDKGNAQVLIDGQGQAVVNLCSSTPVYGAKRSYGGLPYGTHTITIQVLGTTTTCSNTQVAVDAFVVGSTTFQETSRLIAYNTWAGVANLKASGGVFRYSLTLDDVVTYKFTGTAVTWLTNTGPGYGQASVTLDNQPPVTVDLYSPALRFQVPITFPPLEPIEHTLQIKVLHQRNAAAANYKVAIDAFQVTP